MSNVLIPHLHRAVILTLCAYDTVCRFLNDSLRLNEINSYVVLMGEKHSCFKLYKPGCGHSLRVSHLNPTFSRLCIPQDGARMVGTSAACPTARQCPTMRRPRTRCITSCLMPRAQQAATTDPSGPPSDAFTVGPDRPPWGQR
jgi:hypothetical protein